jgi:ParB-like chromosome segregation protein Spo0J
VSDWSDEQKKSYVIADNKLALNSGWDYELLASEIEELKAMEFDVAALGFGEAELDSIFKEDIDMSILDELDDMELDDFEENVKKAIQIEFEREHFGEAQDLIKFWRDKGAYVGHMIMMFLKQEKERL